jgi:hypothetical protein
MAHVRRRAVARLLAAVAVITTSAACADPAPIRDQGYKAVFVDQFDYRSQAEMGATWELHAPFQSPPEPESITFHDDPAIDGNRFVRLTTGAFRDWQWTYISTAGPRRDIGEPSYPQARAWQGGYFEARLRYTANEWAWPAFWLFSHQKVENWPLIVCPPNQALVSEWDILDSGRWDGEAWSRDHYHGALHRNTPWNGPWCGIEDDQRVWSEDPLAGVDLTQWHVWSGRWTERWDGTGEVCIYVDQWPIGCHPTYDSTSQPMVMNLDIKHNGNILCDGCPPPAGTPNLSMDIDWVRVMQKPPA